MHESFKAVLEKEREAEKIVTDAREKAKEIVEKAKEKAEKLYNKIYHENIDEAKDKANRIILNAKKEAADEAQVFLENANEQKEKIQLSAKKKFEVAVDVALNEILS